MGYFRFSLASIVILFHVGGAGFMAGRLAVMGFYVVSGYLITRVVVEQYDGRIGAFAVNRFLRLFPLYWAVTILCYLAYVQVGPVSVGPGEAQTWLPASSAIWRDVLPLVLVMNEGMPHLLGAANLIAQGWSIGVELTFYSMMALFVLFEPKRVLSIVFCASLGYFLVSMYRADSFAVFDAFIYKDALSTAWFFTTGGLLYVYADRVRGLAERVPCAAAIAAMIVLMLTVASGRYLAAMLEASGTHWKAVVIGSNVAMAIVSLTVIVSAPKRETPQSRWLGDLSYGMYLNHFLVAWGVNWFGTATGIYPFGRINDVSYGVAAVLLSASFAWLTFRLIEMPVQKLRTAIRGATVRQSIGAVSKVV